MSKGGSKGGREGRREEREKWKGRILSAAHISCGKSGNFRY